jgi:hypothetical protein
VLEIIAGCKTASERERLMQIKNVEERAANTIIQMNYYPTRFDVKLNPYVKTYKRAPRLDLPFSSKAFDGVVFLDEL